MASGPGVIKPNKAEHPRRKVERQALQAFAPPTGEPQKHPYPSGPPYGKWDETPQGGWKPTTPAARMMRYPPRRITVQ